MNFISSKFSLCVYSIYLIKYIDFITELYQYYKNKLNKRGPSLEGKTAILHIVIWGSIPQDSKVVYLTKRLTININVNFVINKINLRSHSILNYL